MSLFDLIDIASFGSIWYWILLWLLWTLVLNRLLGLPWDRVQRAHRATDPAPGAALLRLFDALHPPGTPIGPPSATGIGLMAFVLTALGLLGFGYGHEFAQALFLLGLPLALAGLLSHRRLRDLRGNELDSATLIRSLRRHRLALQSLALVSIFVTAVWGMLHNLARFHF